MSIDASIFFVLIKDGVAVGVETRDWMAAQRARELSTKNSICTILETRPTYTLPKEKAPVVSHESPEWLCKHNKTNYSYHMCSPCWYAINPPS